VNLYQRLVALTGHKPRKEEYKQYLLPRRGVSKSAEWVRISTLPRRVLDLNNVLDLTPIWRIDDHGCPGCDLCANGPPKLRPIQNAALIEAEKMGGLFAPIGIGHGKELLSLLLPEAFNAQRAVILTKPRLKKQLLEEDIPRYGRHFRLPLDRITVVSYSELSATNKDRLDEIQPDVIIANEAHNLKRRESAKTKKFRRYLENHPGTKYADLTATPASASIKEYAHRIRLALREFAPLPQGWNELDEWSRALDADVKEPMPPGAIKELCGPDAFDKLLTEEERVLVAFDQPQAEEISLRAARQIYRQRLVESYGVIATDGSSADCGLVISARYLQIPENVQKYLDTLRKLWRLDEEEFDEAMQVARVAKQLASGFYYRWVWPNGRDDEWLDARSAWFREVRNILRYRSRKGLESPMEVANAIRRGELQSSAWEEWERVRDRPEPPRETVWLSDFLINDVMAWCEESKDKGPGIVWFFDEAIGDALRDRGVTVYAGKKDGDDINSSRELFIAASLSARSDGANLQHHFNRNLVVTPPADGSKWEQFLGRTHRSGQTAEKVIVDVYQHEVCLRNAWQTALRRVEFSQERKLLDAVKIGFDVGEDDE